MKTAAHRIALLAWAAASVALADSAPCPYAVVTKVPPPICPLWGAMNTTPTSISSTGDWAGYAGTCGESTYDRALYWTPTTGRQDVPLPAGTTASQANGISSQGMVVGWRSGLTDGQSHGIWAFIYFNGQTVEVPPVGVTGLSSAQAVNSLNVVAGYRDVLSPEGNTTRNGFVWADGQITDIDPARVGLASVLPTRISDSGFVTGWVSGIGTINDRAFRWKEGLIEILPPLPGAIRCTAGAVAEDGTVVGTSNFYEGSQFVESRPTVWDIEGDPHELPKPAGGYKVGWCKGISSDGTVLGAVSQPTVTGSPPAQEIVWIAEVPYNLKESIEGEGANPQSGAAMAMNSAGQIVTHGWVEQQPTGMSGSCAWILTPVHPTADLNGDCFVDGLDLGELLQSWGTGEGASADFDGDGLVNGADLGFLLAAWSAE